MLIILSFVLSYFCFKISLIHFNRSSFFDLIDIYFIFFSFVLQVARSSASPLCHSELKVLPIDPIFSFFFIFNKKSVHLKLFYKFKQLEGYLFFSFKFKS